VVKLLEQQYGGRFARGQCNYRNLHLKALLGADFYRNKFPPREMVDVTALREKPITITHDSKTPAYTSHKMLPYD
jgi:hypothetical protein